MSHDELTAKLLAFFEAHVPLTQFMELDVEQYTGDQLILTAPLAPNINDKQTAFGGSLYNACVMACWGFAYLKTLEANLDGNQVVVSGNIKYKRPVTGKIRAICQSPGQEAIDHFVDGFTRHGKGKVTLHATIECDGKVAVEFEGKYAVLHNN